MKTIKIVKSGDKLIGGLRCNEETYNKIKVLSTKHKVSLAVIVRLILENTIDDINIK